MRLKSLLTIVVIVIAATSVAKAGESSCKSDAAYCIYTSGFDSSDVMGRNIKIEFNDGKFAVFCMNDKSTITLSQSKASTQATPTTYTAYICDDRFASKCDKISKDGFTLVQSNSGFIASPYTSGINVTEFINNTSYPACMTTAGGIVSIGNFDYSSPQQ